MHKDFATLVQCAESRSALKEMFTEVLSKMRSDSSGTNGDKQSSSGTSAKTKSLLLAKNMVPDSLKTELAWKHWKKEVEDYTEEMHPGYKDLLDRV